MLIYCEYIICNKGVVVISYKNRKAAFKGGHSKIHLNLSIAHLCGLIVFVSGIESAKDNEVSIVYLRMYVCTYHLFIAFTFAHCGFNYCVYRLFNFVMASTYICQPYKYVC